MLEGFLNDSYYDELAFGRIRNCLAALDLAALCEFSYTFFCTDVLMALDWFDKLVNSLIFALICGKWCYSHSMNSTRMSEE